MFAGEPVLPLYTFPNMPRPSTSCKVMLWRCSTSRLPESSESLPASMSNGLWRDTHTCASIRVPKQSDTGKKAAQELALRASLPMPDTSVVRGLAGPINTVLCCTAHVFCQHLLRPTACTRIPAPQCDRISVNALYLGGSLRCNVHGLVCEALLLDLKCTRAACQDLPARLGVGSPHSK